MNKFMAYMGGVVGGYALILSAIPGTVLSGLNPILHIIGTVSMIVFGGVLIFHAVRSLFT
jgi:hypothetical protein